MDRGALRSHGVEYCLVEFSGYDASAVLPVLTERTPLEAVRVMLRRLYLLIIPLSVYAIKYLRNIGVVYNWSGVDEEWVGLSTDKNSLGQVAMCSGLFLLWDILRDWPEKKAKRVLRRMLLE